jgi:hypothetical protein
MNDFLSSVKDDLLDRRMLPIFALVGVALLGAVAYAVLAGGGSTASTGGSTVSPAPSVTPPSGIAVSQAQTSAGQPVSETTSGSAHRSAGATRNPFAPLPGAKAASATASATTVSSTSSSSSSSSSGSSSTGTSESSGGSSSGGSPSGGTTPAPEAKKPAVKEKSQTVYHVAVRFGTAAPGTPPLTAQLTPYDDLKRQQPLPDAKQPLIVFRGVIAGGKSATFTLVGEAILRGSAACLPSASQCQAIDLKPGQTEELEYIPLGGTAVTYQLEVVRIASSKASASAARRAFTSQSKSGLELLRDAGLEALPGLRYSGANGVLVFADDDHHAFAARAHIAAWGAHL